MSLPENIHKIFMTGIGGAGMCALAQILVGMGYEVSGSDMLESDNTDRLLKQGIKVYIGHDRKNIRDSQLLVYSAAIPESNCELEHAKGSGIPVMTRAELFGEISNGFSDVIAVCGTHGKTTVTSLLVHIFKNSGICPSAVIGGYLPEIGANGLFSGEPFICEACEFAETFLHIKRDYAIILNVDNDHLEFYGSKENLEKSFCEFAKKSKTAFAFSQNRGAVRAVEFSDRAVLFGFDPNDDYFADILGERLGCYEFNLYVRGKRLGNISLRIPGRHNVINALASCAAAMEYGLDFECIRPAVESFRGASRRFELLGSYEGISVADDYAHHPAEIRAVINSARGMNFKRIISVFQPFTYSRTAMLLESFADALSGSDKVFLSPIMGGRETDTYNISSDDLCRIIPGAVLKDNFDELSEAVVSEAEFGDLVITMGCGNIYKCARKIVERLENA